MREESPYTGPLHTITKILVAIAAIVVVAGLIIGRGGLSWF